MTLQEYLSKKGKAPKGKTGWLPFCALEVKTGKLWTGDPMLPNEDDGCLVKVPRGKYLVEGIGMPFGSDRVVSRLRVRLESATEPKPGKEVGDAGTDSCMIGVCEIAAFEAAYQHDAGPDRVQAALDSQTGEGFGILKVPGFPEAIMPFIPTGSDGNGPVLALMSAGKLVGIELPFMDEEDQTS